MIVDPFWQNWRGLKLLIKGILDCHVSGKGLLWSRGWHKFSDWAGNSNLVYPAYPTRYRTLSLERLKQKQGIIWLRMGSDPEKPEIATGAVGDINLFAREIIGSLKGPVILVTTDGDLGVPSGLPKETMSRILEDPSVVAWYTQNLDRPGFHKKLKPIPIGLDLHTRIGRWVSPQKKSKIFLTAMQNCQQREKRLFRVWCDVHLESDLGAMVNEFPEEHGKPGASLFETRIELRAAIESGALDSVIDRPEHRLPVEEIWKTYGRYFFVMSLPGHGLDCHRTWEALALGATVITVHSPLDSLLEKYRVVFLDRSGNDHPWWEPMLSKEWMAAAGESVESRANLDLSWSSWVKPIRTMLRPSRERSQLEE